MDLGFQSEVYEGPTHPEWIKHLTRPSYVDTVAIIVKKDGGSRASIRLSILNRHPEADWTGQITLPNFEIDQVEIHEMYSDDMAATNTWEKPEAVVPKIEKLERGAWENKSKFTVRKHSWAFFIFDGKVTK